MSSLTNIRIFLKSNSFFIFLEFALLDCWGICSLFIFWTASTIFQIGFSNSRFNMFRCYISQDIQSVNLCSRHAYNFLYCFILHWCRYRNWFVAWFLEIVELMLLSNRKIPFLIIGFKSNKSLLKSDEFSVSVLRLHQTNSASNAIRSPTCASNDSNKDHYSFRILTDKAETSHVKQTCNYKGKSNKALKSKNSPEDVASRSLDKETSNYFGSVKC